MLWQQQVLVCYIWFCDLVIKDSYFLHIVCVVANAENIWFVGGRMSVQNLLFLLEL